VTLLQKTMIILQKHVTTNKIIYRSKRLEEIKSKIDLKSKIENIILSLKINFLSNESNLFRM
jgi:hypothetical protein